MSIRAFPFVLLMLFAAGAVQAQEGYWFNSGGEVWRSGAGECVHTGFWGADMKIVGCDGMTAPKAAEPMAQPKPVAPPPVSMASADATVNFGFDRADLDASATAAIDQLVSEARSRGTIKAVRLTGHTDRVGTDDYNMDLSLRRANAVGDYLVDNAGIDRQSIEIYGKGESEPLVGCDGLRGAAALECLAPNRRVDMTFDVAR